MPFPDLPSRWRKRAARSLGISIWIESQRKRRRRGRRDLDDGGVPVEPDKPKNLSGGAAAALEFEDG